MADELLFEDVVQPGETWSHVLKHGTAIRLTDTEGGANVGALLYNGECPVERLNIPDTLKAQHIARLTQGFVLVLGHGPRPLFGDAGQPGLARRLERRADAAMVQAKYGEARYQEHRNGFHNNAQDEFLIELAKYGLGPRDLSPNVNFFSKVTVADGRRDGVTRPGTPRRGVP